MSRCTKLETVQQASSQRNHSSSNQNYDDDDGLIKCQARPRNFSTNSLQENGEKTKPNKPFGLFCPDTPIFIQIYGQKFHWPRAKRGPISFKNTKFHFTKRQAKGYQKGKMESKYKNGTKKSKKKYLTSLVFHFISKMHTSQRGTCTKISFRFRLIRHSSSVENPLTFT